MNMVASTTFSSLLLLVIGQCVALRPAILEPPPTQEDDYVLVDFRSVPRTFSRFSYSGVTENTKRNYSAFVAVLPTDILANFSFELPKGACGYLGTTSSTANSSNCTYATNAGFFNTESDACVGNMISNSVIKQLTGISRVNFALVKGSHVIGSHVKGSYVIGYLTNATIRERKFNWTQLLSGAGWLVRSGMAYINTSAGIEQLNDRFVMEKAPRTGVCAARNGTLVIVQVDGQEDIGAGLDLHEFSEVMVELGCWHAVNLDGGGSSTSVYKGKVVDKPTCHDTSEYCERQVSSITCIKAA